MRCCAKTVACTCIVSICEPLSSASKMRSGKKTMRRGWCRFCSFAVFPHWKPPGWEKWNESRRKWGDKSQRSIPTNLSQGPWNYHYSRQQSSQQWWLKFQLVLEREQRVLNASCVKRPAIVLMFHKLPKRKYSSRAGNMTWGAFRVHGIYMSRFTSFSHASLPTLAKESIRWNTKYRITTSWKGAEKEWTMIFWLGEMNKTGVEGNKWHADLLQFLEVTISHL